LSLTDVAFLGDNTPKKQSKSKISTAAVAAKTEILAQKHMTSLQKKKRNSRPKTRRKAEHAREFGQMRAASNNLELETRCKVCRKAKQEENVKRKWC